MIKPLITSLLAITLAYFTLPVIAPYLPEIRLRVQEQRPQSLDAILSTYLRHDERERIHVLPSAKDATWDADAGRYLLYELADAVPNDSRQYSNTGFTVESNYESFLLSVRPGADPEVEELMKSFKRSRNQRQKSKVKPPSGSSVNLTNLEEKSLEILLKFLEKDGKGPSSLALGKALRNFYGCLRPKIRFPSGLERNLRIVDYAPALPTIQSISSAIPHFDFLVPSLAFGTEPSLNTATPAHVQALRIVEVTLQRSWLDWGLLDSHRNGPWLGAPPALFGPSGQLARIPVRVALVQRPTIRVASAPVVPTASDAAAIVGPFQYSKEEVSASNGSLELRPTKAEWLVLALISRQI